MYYNFRFRETFVTMETQFTTHDNSDYDKKKIKMHMCSVNVIGVNGPIKQKCSKVVISWPS